MKAKIKKGRLYTQPGLATLAEPKATTILNAMDGKPARFFFKKRPLKGRKGTTKRKYMVPVRSGEKGYEDAPYEMAVVFNK